MTLFPTAFSMRAACALTILVTGPAMSETQLMSATDVHAGQQAGGIVIVDIRRPDEWAATGVAQGAHTLDMRAPDFVQRLMAVMEQSGDAELAVICRSGARSAALAAQLDAAGIGPIIDVDGGTLAWIEAELPVDQVNP
ncbi:rhodanese-like domain-containing protein [Pontivivens insulae]|uniref:Thiosulfate sulfurtransferase GlpE n=1 Tax=Pontivivens insulae TaxID=1639689 RepID=A0A2R8ABJ9_9RHOB|nr:rhodanese-like domain-containing protein [Pontivivens insulae]RED11226.1 rhodanese-related sulfurtransferase [Pontivivens insulae]SPF29601.1 Thiosulfate sulfurtransferase GlpE [Pontivivens insulae]